MVVEKYYYQKDTRCPLKKKKKKYRWQSRSSVARYLIKEKQTKKTITILHETRYKISSIPRDNNNRIRTTRAIHPRIQANVVPTATIFSFFPSSFSPVASRHHHPPPINSSPFVTAYPTFSSPTPVAHINRRGCTLPKRGSFLNLPHCRSSKIVPFRGWDRVTKMEDWKRSWDECWRLSVNLFAGCRALRNQRCKALADGAESEEN